METDYEKTINDAYGVAVAEIERLYEMIERQGKIIEGLVPALDRLQEQLEQGAEMTPQDGYWYLFAADGESICRGVTIRDMLINLVLTIC